MTVPPRCCCCCCCSSCACGFVAASALYHRTVSRRALDTGVVSSSPSSFFSLCVPRIIVLRLKSIKSAPLVRASPSSSWYHNRVMYGTLFQIKKSAYATHETRDSQFWHTLLGGTDGYFSLLRLVVVASRCSCSSCSCFSCACGFVATSAPCAERKPWPDWLDRKVR